jgi:HAD superfamily hydrolase (TIGR01490 family)
MLQHVDWHRGQGHELVLITAANHFLAEAIAKKLQLQNIICTQAEIKQGKFTGKIKGVPAFQEGKVTLLAEWLREKQMTLDGSWGYSDSHNDLPLLNLVENPVAVRPDAKLRSHALLHGWRLLDE